MSTKSLIRSASLALTAILITFARPGLTQAAPAFTSPASLLLKQNALPHGYRYRNSFVQHSVERWDGDIAPVLAIDEQNGWLAAAQESALDPSGRTVMLSVQLFTTDSGARRDFAQFFTNAHPQTRFLPDTYWLGGTPARGLGNRATLYHILDKSSPCPRHQTAGLSFVYRNALFSASVCQGTPGDRGVRELARRLYARAQKIG